MKRLLVIATIVAVAATAGATQYSRLGVITAAKEMGKWPQLKAWIKAAGYEDEWLVCSYLSDDFPQFSAITNAVVEAGIATQAEVAAILESAKDTALPDTLVNRKYSRAMNSSSGRTAWHGKHTLTIDTNACLRVWVYEDGYTYTEKWAKPKSEVEKNLEAAARLAAQAKREAKGKPSKVQRIILKRAAAQAAALTNGVETVKKFEDVRAEVEKEVRLIESVQGLTTGLYSRVYGVKAAAGKSRLDEIAAESSAKVETSDWFALGGNYKDGFMKRASQICPGAQNFEEVVAELDSSSEDLRYGVVASDKEVWLVEKAETNAAHVPTFEEAKDIIRPRALAAAKADAFKAKVEAIAKKGVKAVLESGDVSTNITFTVCDMKSGDFPDQGAIVGAAMKLRKGEVSEFAPTGVGKAILVVCEDRVPGDAAKAQIWKLQVRSEVEALQRRQVPESWKKWNLDRLGFEPGEGASVVDAETEE